MRDPSLALLAQAAHALGDLRERVVFIGGSVAPILQTDPPFDRARPTKDVDAIASTASYGDFAALGDACGSADSGRIHRRPTRTGGSAREIRR